MAKPNRCFKMKKVKKLIVLIVVLILFGMLHCYTEKKFSDTQPKGVTEQIEEWVSQLGLD